MSWINVTGRVKAITCITLLVTIFLPCMHGSSAPADELSTFVWDLEALYPNEASWQSVRQEVLRRCTAVAEFKGTLAKDPKALATALDQVSQLRSTVTQMNIYAELMTDLDSHSEQAQSRYDTATALQSQVESSVSFISSELAAIDQSRIRNWLQTEPGLRKHRARIMRILSVRDHILPTDQQAIVATMSRWPLLAADTFWALHDSDLGWPVLNVKGEQVPVNLSSYRGFEGSDSSNGIKLFLTRLKGLETVFGLLYTRRIDADLTIARHQKFDSGITALWMLRDGMPQGSERVMIDVARQNLPTLRRYVRLRARALQLGDPSTMKLYVPIKVNRPFPIQAAIEAAIAASSPLGTDYQERLQGRLHKGWMHLPPTPGKHNLMDIYPGVNGGHPYFLMNYKSDYASSRDFVGGLTSMMKEADIPRENVPDTIDDPPTYGNAILYVGDMLHDDYMIRNAKSAEEKVSFLVSTADLLWARYFRWVIVAELDAAVEKKIIDGHTPSGSEVSQMYQQLLQDYYGKDLVNVEQAQEWMTFSVPFLSYEHQFWASAIAAASIIKNRLDTGDPTARVAVDEIYGRTETDRSYQILKGVGIDMTQPEPYRAVIVRLNKQLDQIETLLTAK